MFATPLAAPAKGMRSKALLSLFFLLLVSGTCFSQGGFRTKENGVNLQHRNGRIAFIGENSKLRVRLYNGSEVSGRLTGADSSAVFISRSGGNQVRIEHSSIKKITVFHERDYLSASSDMLGWGWGCNDSGCDAVAAAVVVVAIVAIVVGELIIDGIADIANDEHFDLQRDWRISGPVVGR
jgi:hypothetical protein